MFKLLILLILLIFANLCKGQICNVDTYYINTNSDIDDLKNCSIINGNLFINGEYNIDSLDKLTSLTNINGYLVILDSHIINSLNGLQNLKSISGTSLYLNQYSVVIKYNVNERNDTHQGLCYSNNIDWPHITNHSVKILNNGQNCPECHPECNGCWGPGPSLCQFCQNFKYDDTCVSNCPGSFNGITCDKVLPNRQY